MFIVQIPASMPAVPLTESLVRESFGRAALEAGRIYEARGRVVALTVPEDGGMIEAQTVGTAPQPYHQVLTVRQRPLSRPIIVGQCTCPVRHNCKHCAAAAIAALHHSRPFDASPDQSLAAQLPAAPSPPAAADEPLPFPITNWLNDLQTIAEREREDYPPTVKQRVIYLIDQDSTHGGTPRMVIRPFTGTMRKDGSLGSMRQYPPSNVSGGAGFLRPSDKLILNRLALRSAYHGPPSIEETDDTLRRILATGRAWWMEHAGAPLAEGPPRPGALDWQMAADGSQRAVLVLPDGPSGDGGTGLTTISNPAPWYVDPQCGHLGKVTLDMPPAVVARLLSAPPIPAEAAVRVRAEIARRLPSIAVPPPREPAPATALTDPLRPRLRLMRGTLPVDNPFHRRLWRSGGEQELVAAPVARLAFDYGPVSIPYASRPAATRVFRHEDQFYEPRRDPKGEAAAVWQLQNCGTWRIGDVMPVAYRHAFSDDFTLSDDAPDVAWVNFLSDDLPRLRAAGWAVVIDDDFPYRIPDPDAPIDARLESRHAPTRPGETKGDATDGAIDWLELHVGVQVDGMAVDILPALTRMLRDPDLAQRLGDADPAPVAVPLGDGRFVSIGFDRLRPTLEALLELHDAGLVDTEGGRVGFTRLDAAALAGVRATAAWAGGEALRSLGQKLREAGDAIPRATVPDSFKGTLRAYQAQGVDWLQFLASAELGGVLADDMGLGKTVQTLAHIVIEKEAGRLDRPALIVCPTSLIPNWRDEAARFAPGLKVLVLHGLGRQKLFGQIGDHDLVLTTYPLLARDHEALTPLDWHMVVLDEAQTIKNPNATTTRQALRLRARQRLCLSGTPLQNHLGELWSLFDFLAPGFLGNQASFRSRYRNPIEKHGDAARSEALARRVRPFLLRRTKEEVATELPPKTEITERVEMEAGQRAVYEAIRLSMHSRVQAAIAAKGLARSGIIILDALLKMRQACCDPRLLKLPSIQRNKAGSAKLDRLMELLGVMLAEGRRVLLFSQFTEMLALIEARLAADNVGYVLLTGDTKDRATPVKRFQAGEVPLFLISLKAGGVGLNLTAADTVIHYDPWWNPATEDQATDRAHRIGQTKNVFVHRLVALGTIEEKMELLKEKKRALVASVMEAEHGGALRLTESDVAELFGGA